MEQNPLRGGGGGGSEDVHSLLFTVFRIHKLANRNL